MIRRTPRRVQQGEADLVFFRWVEATAAGSVECLFSASQEGEFNAGNGLRLAEATS